MALSPLRFPRSGLVFSLLLVALVPEQGALGAQEPIPRLPLQREYPGPGPFECPATPLPVAPSDDDRERAAQLTSDALQANILGDLEGARSLLSQASEMDPTSPEYAYRHARVLEDLGLIDAAILEYCRSQSLGAVEAGILDGRDRLDSLYEIVRERISDLAISAFLAGIGQADSGLYAEAASSFAEAIEEVPEWAAPVYNRALVLEQLGLIQESVVEYRRYLELTPSEVDPVVAGVAERIGALEGELTRPTPSPGSALALGVLFPGMGQYYSGRGRAGTFVLSIATGALIGGLAVKKVTVRCLSAVGAGEDCPPGEIVDETSRRPYLTPALGATAVLGVVAAIEAFVRARGQRAEQAEAAEAAGAGEPTAQRGPRLGTPSVAARAGRTEFTLLQLRFR